MTLTTPSSQTPAIDRVLDRIEAFEATLTSGQRAQLHLPYQPALAARWSNLPEAVLGDAGRVGLRTATLDEDAWTALWDLLGATTGSGAGVGLDALRQHLAADDLLAAQDPGMGYARTAFTIALLGRPDPATTFAVQFGGHHLALLNTYRGGELVAATPAFRGIEPFAPFTREGRVNHPLGVKHAALSELLLGLGERQRAAARLRNGPHDLLLGPGRDWSFPDRRQGVNADELDPIQRDRLLQAIASFTADVQDEAAQRMLADYEAELQGTSIAFGGRPSLTAVGDYVRIDGPTLWIEMSMRPGINFTGPHPHAVWRDRARDYAGDR